MAPFCDPGIPDTSILLKLQQYLEMKKRPVSLVKVTDIAVVDDTTMNVGAVGTV